MRATLAFLAYNNDQSIETFLDKQISEEAKKWHEVLTILLDIVRSLSTLGMPFRGHRENLDGLNCGLFLTVVKLIARYNPTFNAHLNSQSRIKYVSKTITDELISMIALETRKSILDLCKEAKFFTLIADSTTDISHVDQMAILVRYVHIDREKNNVTINESFLSFIDIQQADAAALCSRIVNVLFGDYGLNRNYLCGQGYDGASVMSGARGGLQAKIKDYLGDHLYAPYIHCPAHQINLVLVHAAENRASPTTKCFFAVIQSVYTYFAFSNRRWALLLKKSENHEHLTSLAQESDSIVTKENSQLDDICNFDDLEDCSGIPQEESSSAVENEKELYDVAPSSSRQEYKKPRHVPLRLKALCETRWFARLKAVDAMKENFLNIIECLEDEAHAQRSNGEDVMKARTLLLSMDWVFYLNLLWWQKVLTVMDAVARILQSKSIDLFLVAEIFKVTIQKLQNLRSDDAYFDLIKCAREEWEAMGLEQNDFPVQRERRVPRRDGETLRDVALSPLEKHKLGYFEVLDNMLGEMRERCNGFQEVSELFGFLQPQRLSGLSSVELGKPVELLLKKYSVFSPELLGNLVLFQTYYFEVQKHVKTGSACPTSTVLNYLQFIISSSLEDVLPEMSMLCRIFLTLPIGIASAERSMSTLRRVKNYMRSTMTQKRLSDLALLAIEQATVYNLDLSKLIEAFAKAKARRGSVFL
ncbi:zinc finger MYM-type protein 1-like [Ambystoma mexicanum]|uniref:zinc finger MYM-type protein 1-like n=1 Tax=Ambystoma mexicanum TaxID=8296 RepID=UPI0037E8F8EA